MAARTASATSKTAATKKAAPTKTATAKKAAAKKPAPAKKASSAKKAAPASKTPVSKTTAKVAGGAEAGTSAEKWSKKELAALRSEIEADIAHLEEEIATAEAELQDLMQDAGDGAGDDQADAGAKTFEREQEISLANNSRDLLDQNRRALERMDNGSYGICENCGQPIAKLRLQAAPRATLCMPCKTKEERR